MEAENFRIALGNKGSIAGSVHGQGPRLLLCFHGYGQSRKLFLPLLAAVPEGWRVVTIDLLFFGSSEWTDERIPVMPADWDLFLTRLLEKYPSTEVHFLAFSLGAKVALSLYQATQIPIRQMILISPDGLRIHPLYRFCIYNPVGKALFYSVLRWPWLFLSVIRLLYKLGITDAFKYKFINRQFDTVEKRALLRRVWRGHSKLRPNLDAIARRSRETDTLWHIIWGAQDNILH
ncbi:MAG TPA: alpha/beta hydrolase, partial [Bacteroidia bacterium]|nr:alpha/beta hydrolase [Bacteroidia bacterium]